MVLSQKIFVRRAPEKIELQQNFLDIDAYVHICIYAKGEVKHFHIQKFNFFSFIGAYNSFEHLFGRSLIIFHE